MENPNEVLCYDKYKLGRIDGKFSSEMKKLVIPATPMTRGVAENYNAVTEQSGVLFVVNAEKTKEYKAYEKQRKADMAEKKDRKLSDAKDLINNVFETLLKERSAAGSTKEITVAEMRKECEAKGYLKTEWQNLTKPQLIDYLKSKTE